MLSIGDNNRRITAYERDGNLAVDIIAETYDKANQIGETISEKLNGRVFRSIPREINGRFIVNITISDITENIEHVLIESI